MGYKPQILADTEQRSAWRLAQTVGSKKEISRQDVLRLTQDGERGRTTKQAKFGEEIITAESLLGRSSFGCKGRAQRAQRSNFLFLRRGLETKACSIADDNKILILSKINREHFSAGLAENMAAGHVKNLC